MRDWAVRIFALLLVVLPPMVAHAGPNSGTYAPQGSYLLSCGDIKFDQPSQMLSARCRMIPDDGNSLAVSPSLLHVSACDPGADIESLHGYLQCRARAGTWGEGGAVPKGSYQLSCFDLVVQTGSLLTAFCWDYSHGRVPASISAEGWQNVSLDLSQCGMGGDIENHAGQLLCTQPAPNQPPAQQAKEAGASLAAPGSCKPGYVWRQADGRDHVCVTAQTRQQVADDNAAAREHGYLPDLIKHTPGACFQGYVWRQADAADYVCVTPQTRDQAASDNAAAASRTN